MERLVVKTIVKMLYFVEPDDCYQNNEINTTFPFTLKIVSL